MEQTQNEKLLQKLVVKNVFNSIRQDTLLQASQTHFPEIYPLIWDRYSSKISLLKTVLPQLSHQTPTAWLVLLSPFMELHPSSNQT